MPRTFCTQAIHSQTQMTRTQLRTFLTSKRLQLYTLMDPVSWEKCNMTPAGLFLRIRGCTFRNKSLKISKLFLGLVIKEKFPLALTEYGQHHSFVRNLPLSWNKLFAVISEEVTSMLICVRSFTSENRRYQLLAYYVLAKICEGKFDFKQEIRFGWYIVLIFTKNSCVKGAALKFHASNYYCVISGYGSRQNVDQFAN